MMIVVADEGDDWEGNTNDDDDDDDDDDDIHSTVNTSIIDIIKIV